MAQPIEALRSHVLLDGLPEHELANLAPRIKEVYLGAGETLVTQGERSDACYLIARGRLKADGIDPETGTSVHGHFYPADVVGDVAVLAAQPYRATVRAERASRLIRVPAADFRRLVGKYPELRDELRHKSPGDPRNNVLFTLPNLRPDERIVEQGRRHWIVLLRSLLVPSAVVVLFVAILGQIVLSDRTWWQTTPLFSRILWLALVTTGLTAWFLWALVDWLNDFHIVTTHRVIHIEKVAFFFEERHEMPIEKIQDVTLRQHNPLHELLNYGDLLIQTASQVENVQFHYVPRPAHLQRLILTHKDAFESLRRRREQYEKRRTIRRLLRNGSVVSQEQQDSEAETGHERQRPGPQSAFDRFITYLNPFRLEEERPGGALLWRKHWIVLVGDVWPVLLYNVLLIAALVVALVYVERDSTPLVSPFLLFSLVAVLGGIGLFWLYWVYEDWRNDVYVLTGDAVVDEEKQPLGFEKQVRRAPLDTIQDIQYEIPNPVYTLLNVGNVLIQTASTEGRLTFDTVHRPREITRHVYERLRARREAVQQRQQRRRDEAIAEMLAIYEELKREHA